MRRISDRSFEGPAGEVVSVRVYTLRTAAARVWLDGSAVADSLAFPIQTLRHLAVLLSGEPGEQATVEISTAAGVHFVDVLLATPHDPFPIHHYGFRAV